MSDTQTSGAQLPLAGSPGAYTVVVGVSATSGSPQALRWAAAQAERTNGRLVAVRAWRMRTPAATPSGTSAGRIDNRAESQAAAQAALEEDVRRVLGSTEDAELATFQGGAFEGLMEAAQDADLLVVDAPRQLIAGPMFAHRLVYAAPCPVVVMPPTISEEPPSTLAKLGRRVGERMLFAAGTAGRPGYRLPPGT